MKKRHLKDQIDDLREEIVVLIENRRSDNHHHASLYAQLAQRLAAIENQRKAWNGERG